jgi:hypothetical protein
MSEGKAKSHPTQQASPQVTPAGFVVPYMVEGEPPFLREKLTGQLWPYTETMAQRGDLVEGYWPEGGPVAVVAKAPVKAKKAVPPPPVVEVPLADAIAT